MQPLDEFLADLAGRDVRVWVDQGKLRLNAPAGVLTPQLRDAIAARKAELLDFLGGLSATPAAVRRLGPRDPSDVVPITAGQRRVWALAAIAGESSIYNVPTFFRLKGRLNSGAMERAIARLVREHALLRTRLVEVEDGSVIQEIAPVADYRLPKTDLAPMLAAADSASRGARVLAALRAEAVRPFNLSRGPLWRARLFRLGRGDHVLGLTMHHVIFDGTSKNIFLSLLSRAFAAELDEAPPADQPPALQFADYAVWESRVADQKALQVQRDYWRGKLAAPVHELNIANDKARSGGKGTCATLRFRLPAETAAALDAFLKAEQCSHISAMIAAFALMLHRHTGQQDQLLCVPVAKRSLAEVETMLGYFNNIVVVRVSLAGNPTVAELLRQVRRSVIEAQDHQDLPLQDIAGFPDLVRVPLGRAMVSFQETGARRMDLPGIESGPIVIRKDSADFDIALYVERNDTGIEGVLDYNTELFSPARAKRLLHRWVEQVGQLSSKASTRIADMKGFGRSLETLEQRIAEDPGIDQAVLAPDAGTGRPVAYVVLNEHDVPRLQDVRQHAESVLPAYRHPLAYVPIDTVPLTPEGAVDFDALPAPSSDRGRLSTDYAAPRTPLQRTLVDLWKRVLWLDVEIGIDDDFAELGGHSLLSVQLVAEIEKTLGRSLPARVLTRITTIAELSEALESPEPEDEGADLGSGPLATGLPEPIYRGILSHISTWQGVRLGAQGLIVGLNTTGKRRPLFWCLQRYGELTQLARYLGEDQPVYGMRSGNRVMEKTDENIGLLAAHYVAEIQAIHPVGPCFVGGNCQAASIAFDVASGLRALGREVSLLMLHERFVPRPYDGPVALTFGADSSFNPFRAFPHPERGWRKYYSGPMAWRIVRGAHGQFFREPNVEDLTGTISRFMAEALAPDRPSGEAGAFQRLLDSDRRAQLVASMPATTLAPGETVEVPVSVRNLSRTTWQPGGSSAIALMNRWRDPRGRILEALDGCVPLPSELPPDASVELVLRVTAPRQSGPWIAEIDLAEEGVGWFQESGSRPALVRVEVR